MPLHRYHLVILSKPLAVLKRQSLLYVLEIGLYIKQGSQSRYRQSKDGSIFIYGSAIPLRIVIKFSIRPFSLASSPPINEMQSGFSTGKQIMLASNRPTASVSLTRWTAVTCPIVSFLLLAHRSSGHLLGMRRAIVSLICRAL